MICFAWLLVCVCVWLFGFGVCGLELRRICLGLHCMLFVAVLGVDFVVMSLFWYRIRGLDCMLHLRFLGASLPLYLLICVNFGVLVLMIV